MQNKFYGTNLRENYLKDLRNFGEKQKLFDENHKKYREMNVRIKM